MSVDKNPARWYIYRHREKGGLATSLDSPDVVNVEDKYEVWGPFKNSEIVDQWIQKRKDLVKDAGVKAR